MAKVTVQFSDELDGILSELAECRGLAKTQVLRRAVLLMKYLDKASAEGADLVLRDRESGRERQLVMESSIQ